MKLTVILILLIVFISIFVDHTQCKIKLGKGVKSLGKDIGKGVSNVGKEIGKGASNVGKEVGKGAGNVGKEVGKGAANLGKEVGKGTQNVGKEVGKGADKVGKEAEHVGKEVGKGAEHVGKEVGKGADKVGKEVKHEVKQVEKSIDHEIQRIIDKEEQKIMNKVKIEIEKMSTDLITNDILGNQVDRDQVQGAVHQVPGAIQQIGGEIVSYTKNFTLDGEKESTTDSNPTKTPLSVATHTTFDFIDELKQTEINKLNNQNKEKTSTSGSRDEFDLMNIDKDAKDVLTNLGEHYNENDQINAGELVGVGITTVDKFNEIFDNVKTNETKGALVTELESKIKKNFKNSDNSEIPQVFENIEISLDEVIEEDFEHYKEGDMIKFNLPYPVLPNEKFVFLYHELVIENENSTDYIELVSDEYESESLKYTVNEDGISGVASKEGTYEANITVRVYSSQATSEFKIAYASLYIQVRYDANDVSSKDNEASEKDSGELSKSELLSIIFVCFGVLSALLILLNFLACVIIYKWSTQNRGQNSIQTKVEKQEDLEQANLKTSGSTDDELDTQLEFESEAV